MSVSIGVSICACALKQSKGFLSFFGFSSIFCSSRSVRLRSVRLDLLDCFDDRVDNAGSNDMANSLPHIIGRHDGSVH